MGRSRDFRNYIIVTKHPSYDFYYKGDQGDMIDVENEFDSSKDKTFWMYTKDGEFVDRYSTRSAPQWVAEIYEILTGDKCDVR